MNENIINEGAEAVMDAAKEGLTGMGAVCMGLTIVGGITVIGGATYGAYKIAKHFIGKKDNKAADENKTEDPETKDDNEETQED